MSDSTRIAFWIYILALLLIFGMPTAQAHTSEDIDAWMIDWQANIPESGMTIEHIELFIDWHERHFYHFHDRPVSRAPVRPTVDKPPGRGMGTNVEQWRGLVAQYFPADQVDRALCIMSYESGGNELAKNPRSSASGLFQHLARYWPERSAKAGWAGADIFDPTANVAVAAWLWGQGGWWHWSPYKRGECR